MTPVAICGPGAGSRRQQRGARRARAGQQQLAGLRADNLDGSAPSRAAGGQVEGSRRSSAGHRRRASRCRPEGSGRAQRVRTGRARSCLGRACWRGGQKESGRRGGRPSCKRAAAQQAAAQRLSARCGSRGLRRLFEPAQTFSRRLAERPTSLLPIPSPVAPERGARFWQRRPLTAVAVGQPDQQSWLLGRSTAIRATSVAARGPPVLVVIRHGRCFFFGDCGQEQVQAGRLQPLGGWATSALSGGVRVQAG